MGVECVVEWCMYDVEDECYRLAVNYVRLSKMTSVKTEEKNERQYPVSQSALFIMHSILPVGELALLMPETQK